MSRWIDAESLMDKAKEYGGYYEDTVYAVPLADISESPSIDLVRCGECKRWNTDGCHEGCGECEWAFYMTKPDDYCSYGEREGE